MSKKEYSDEELIDYSVYDDVINKVQKKSKPPEAAGSNTILTVFILGIIIFGGLLFSGALTGGPYFGGDSGDNGDNILNNNNDSALDLLNECIDHSEVSPQNHYHYNVFITTNGNSRLIPTEIGITDTCMKPIHTHDATGEVHVELPLSYTGSAPNIGHFFQVWGQPFGEDKLLDATGNVTLTANGQTFTDDFVSFIPSDGMNIYLTLA